jgi:hypothetical protein
MLDFVADLKNVDPPMINDFSIYRSSLEEVFKKIISRKYKDSSIIGSCISQNIL